MELELELEEEGDSKLVVQKSRPLLLLFILNQFLTINFLGDRQIYAEDVLNIKFDSYNFVTLLSIRNFANCTAHEKNLNCSTEKYLNRGCLYT